MNVKMKIRPHFLDLIRKGIKKHEYRLADAERKKICIGDTLILVSNQNPAEYVKVIVKGIQFKKDWESALSDYWEEDFSGLFKTKEEALRECYRFYPKKRVDECGIEVFEIQVDKPIFKNARFLLDTNTIIERESHNNVINDVIFTYNKIEELQGKKYYHPVTREEIGKYKPEAREAMLKKLNAYNELKDSDLSNRDFELVCDQFSKDDNSLADNKILQQVYNGNCDFLITSDQLICEKARRLYLQDRVFTPHEFLDKLEEEYPTLVDYDVLSIRLKKIGDLAINDPFFDSLREDYNGIQFNDWLKKKSEEQAYVFEEKGQLKGFLYLKTEDEDESYIHFDPPFAPAKRLKVGTFKIAKSGMRIGERFLKIIFDNALKRNVDEIYVTMFEGKREEVGALKKLMMDWGFEKVARNKNNGEIVLAKNMRKYDPTKSPKANFPLINPNAKKSFLAIMSEHHNKLFPDLRPKKQNLNIYDEVACRYAMEKIYVCNFNPRKIKPGDILCIYKMAEYYKKFNSAVTGIGVLSEVIYPTNKEEFLHECRDKSVFTNEELESFYTTKKYDVIIKILYLKGFERNVNLDTMYAKGILVEGRDAPRMDTIIDEDSFKKLEDLGGLE